MFTGASSGTPPTSGRKPRRTAAAAAASTTLANRRTSTRSAFSSLPQSGQTTPRGGAAGDSPSLDSLRNAPISQALSAANDALLLGAGQTPRSLRRAKLSLAGGAFSETNSIRNGAVDVKGALEEGSKILVQDASYVVTERKGLPVEVEQVILSADAYTDPFRASLDSTTGFAYLISRDFCIVWSWARRTSAPTTYVFPLPVSQVSLPTSVTTFSPLSFACFVPTPTQQREREPGLLVVSTTGEIRYWESISMALSGVERWKTCNQSSVLNEAELVRDLTSLTNSSFVVSTSQARLLLIVINSTGGRISISMRPFGRSSGWAGSVWSAVFGGKVPDPRAGILAVAIAPSSMDGDRQIYAVTEKSVEVWTIPPGHDGGERLLATHVDLFTAVLEGLTGGKVGNEEWATNTNKVEIIDASVIAVGQLGLLVSYVAEHTAPNALSFALMMIDVKVENNGQSSASSSSVRRLAYQTSPDPRPLSTPRLTVFGNSIAFVVFVDAVIMVTIGPEAFSEESFPLRSNTHRFLGFSTPTLAPTASLSFLTSMATYIAIDASVLRTLGQERPGSEKYKTRKLQTKIEQAIYFGGKSTDNPLAFDVHANFEGDLTSAIDTISAELLSSSCPSLPVILDLRAQLTDRVSRARSLIDYINSNGLGEKLSQTSRRKLSWDAERLVTANALWHHQNANLGRNESSLLVNIISTVMNDIGDGYGEDRMRLFFRTKIAFMGRVIDQIMKKVKELHATSTSEDIETHILLESNVLILLIYDAIARHRRESGRLYGIETGLLLAEPWSSTPVKLEGLEWHFEATAAILRERVRHLGSAIDDERAMSTFGAGEMAEQQGTQAVLKTQMTALAEYFFTMNEERLKYLKDISDSGTSSAESRELSRHYLSVRPTFIQKLVQIGHINHAYDIAERHRDFHSLVELCNDPKHGTAARSHFFLQKFGEEFAFPLYQFFINKGRIKSLLEQFVEYRVLLTRFLDRTDNDRISWLNDVIIGRHDHASETLCKTAETEQVLGSKKLMLSLGKLAQVAQMTQADIHTEPAQRAIEAIDDRLDLVNSQQTLFITFTDALSGSESRMSNADKGRVITARFAPTLVNKAGLAQLYADLCRQLFHGKTLSAEDLVDLLTLKENVGDQSGDFASALEILVRARSLPEGRKDFTSQNIWRRVYLQDDWASLYKASDLKDEDMQSALQNTALFATLRASSESEQLSALYRSPAQSLYTGAPEELRARFSTSSTQEIDLLMKDFASESDTLREAINDYGLDSYCAEIIRLVEQDRHEDTNMLIQ